MLKLDHFSGHGALQPPQLTESVALSPYSAALSGTKGRTAPALRCEVVGPGDVVGVEVHVQLVPAGAQTLSDRAPASSVDVKLAMAGSCEKIKAKAEDGSDASRSEEASNCKLGTQNRNSNMSSSGCDRVLWVCGACPLGVSLSSGLKPQRLDELCATCFLQLPPTQPPPPCAARMYAVCHARTTRCKHAVVRELSCDWDAGGEGRHRNSE